jgi:hypothetical protein
VLSNLTTNEQSLAAVYIGLSVLPILGLMLTSAVRTFRRWSA